MNLLSHDLFREVRPEFLRLLSGSSARIYLDVLDGLEIEASLRNEGMSREEALALVAETLEVHPTLSWEEEEGMENYAALTLREKSRLVLDRLAACGWLEEQVRPDYQRVLFFDPNGSILLEALRRMARPEATVFSDKLLNVCSTLANGEVMAQQPWEQIEVACSNVQHGLQELRAMQKSVERFTRRQVAARTIRDNLQVFFDEYAERVGRTCYTELVRAKLPTRLAETQRRIDELLDQPELMTKMQVEVMRREQGLAAPDALLKVRHRLDELSRLLGMVVPLAEMIDRRTAEFTRRSLSRFRYLQEVVSERRGQVQAFFETINRQFAGKRMGDLDDQVEVPAMLLQDVRLMAGLDSLFIPRMRRPHTEMEPIGEDLDESMREHCKREIESSLRDSMTVRRANRFVESLPGEAGARISSAELPLRHEDDLADIIACLLHCESAEARFQLEVNRMQEDCPEVEFHQKVTYRIEKFFLVKK